MNKLKWLVKNIPFIILFTNLLSLIFAKYGIYLTQDYWVLFEFSGNSFLAVIFMAFYAHIHRFCLYSKACIYGLGVINLLNIAYFFNIFDYNYITLYSEIIVYVLSVFVAIKWTRFLIGSRNMYRY